jgi:hypothetical protein
MKKAIGNLIFDTDISTALARSSDGDVLYRAPKGRFFMFSNSLLSEPEITIMTTDEALSAYNRFAEKLVDFKSAFPDIEFRDA